MSYNGFVLSALLIRPPQQVDVELTISLEIAPK